jgi:pyruvate oxidase
MQGYKEFSTDLVNPNFSDFAKSCGGEGFRVEKAEELDKTLQQAFNLDKPVIVEIIVDRKKLAPGLGRFRNYSPFRKIW